MTIACRTKKAPDRRPALPADPIEPLSDYVLLEPADPETMTPGGVMLPDAAAGRGMPKATVLAIGPGRLLPDGSLTKMTVAIGQQVIYSEYSGTNLKRGDQ